METKNLPEGCEEEAVGHNAIAAGFQGQRQWTDFYPNGDFAEANPEQFFRLEWSKRAIHSGNRERRIKRT